MTDNGANATSINPVEALREITNLDKLRVNLSFMALEQWVIDPTAPLGDLLYELHLDAGLAPSIRGDQFVARESAHSLAVLEAWASGLGVPVEEPEPRPRFVCATPDCGNLAYWNYCHECTMSGKAR